MKQKDVATIFIVAVVSAVLSIIFSNSLFTAPENRQELVEVVDPINTELTDVSSDYFNSSSVNPAKRIEAGSGDTGNPFSDGE